jgi:DNA methylase
MFDSLEIPSPKRSRSRDAFQEFYPYYAGFPQKFVSSLLQSARCAPGSVVFDPWNGSGTTTAAATKLGLPSIGFDLNPAMVVIAKARLLQPSEASSLIPLAKAIIKSAPIDSLRVSESDPLLVWFQPSTAGVIRALESAVRQFLVDQHGVENIDLLSSTAATFYTSLFALARQAAARFRTSNPTWTKIPSKKHDRIRIGAKQIIERFEQVVEGLSVHLRDSSGGNSWRSSAKVIMADATSTKPLDDVDCVVTSPPYCTRIDYVAATRIELAVLSGLSALDSEDLRRRMVGTTKVPKNHIDPLDSWGPACLSFLDAVRNHSSRASKTYYYPTHLDYFDKLNRSIAQISRSLRPSAPAFLIVQDSYYKEIHNDLAGIVTEMARSSGLELRRRADFHSSNCMSRINSRSVAHETRKGSVESVVCFEKVAGS